MKLRLIGAVSATAIGALALSACGERAYDRQAEATDRAAQEERFAEDGFDDQRLAQDPAGVRDPMAVPPAQPSAQPAPTAGLQDPIPVDLAQLTDESDARELADRLFEQADINNDGVLSRSEYMRIALGAAQWQSQAALSPMDPTQQPDDLTVQGDDLAITGRQEGDPAVTSPSPSQPGAPTLPRTAQTDIAIDEMQAQDAFMEAAGDDGRLTRESLREAFLAWFERADEDNSGELDESQRETFAQLLTGAELPE